MNTFARLGLTVVPVAALGVVGLTVLRPSPVGPAAKLGIFEPAADRIVYGTAKGIWGVAPTDLQLAYMKPCFGADLDAAASRSPTRTAQTR